MSRLLAFSSPSSTVLGRATRAVASANATTRRITAKRERTLHWRNNLDADSVLRSSSRLKVRALDVIGFVARGHQQRDAGNGQHHDDAYQKGPRPMP